MEFKEMMITKPYEIKRSIWGDVTRPMELDLLAPKQRDWNKT